MWHLFPFEQKNQKKQKLNRVNGYNKRPTRISKIFPFSSNWRNLVSAWERSWNLIHVKDFGAWKKSRRRNVCCIQHNMRFFAVPFVFLSFFYLFFVPFFDRKYNGKYSRWHIVLIPSLILIFISLLKTNQWVCEEKWKRIKNK